MGDSGTGVRSPHDRTGGGDTPSGNGRRGVGNMDADYATNSRWCGGRSRAILSQSVWSFNSSLGEVAMSRIRFGTGFTVFVLFFGIAALDAIRTREWLRVAFWMAIGAVFLLLDRKPVNR
jgi:hypothetical protein